MEAPVLLERLLAGGAAALVLAGAASALMSSNAIKRLAGVTVSGFGVLVALALWAPQVLMAAVAIMFAQLAVGAAIIVRLQETYGSVEVREIDALDAAAEPRDRGQ
ncbi:MAG: NADH-quinone oxidoreductase subunit K [Hyphomonadaceae bacterium]